MIEPAVACDADGREIQVGDIVEHIFGPWDSNKGETIHDFFNRQPPEKYNWRFTDGFHGKREVMHLHTGVVLIKTGTTRPPGYLSTYVRVVE